MENLGGSGFGWGPLFHPTHAIDPWRLRDFQKGALKPGYVNRQTNELQQLARAEKIMFIS
jgi:hypothetical protein